MQRNWLKLFRPSKILLLTNMVDVSEIDDNLYEDVGFECSQHGGVRNVQIFTMDQAAPEELVRIFVEFDTYCSLDKQRNVTKGEMLLREHLMYSMGDTSQEDKL